MFTIQLYNGTTYSNLSQLSNSFDETVSSVVAQSATTCLYIGASKPFNNLFFQLGVLNSVTSTISVKYYTSSGWVAVDNLFDKTNCFKRSGRVYWDRPSVLGTEWEETTVNSIEKYWIKIEVANTLTATMTMIGVGILLSEDSALQREFYPITGTEFLLGASSHIKTHMFVKEEIIGYLQNRNKLVSLSDIEDNKITGSRKMTELDLLDIKDVEIAAVFLCLSKIFRNVSDSDDNWKAKSIQYYDLYLKTIERAIIFIDSNGDGIASTSEAKTFRQVRLIR